jgi:hypothetical protein
MLYPHLYITPSLTIHSLCGGNLDEQRQKTLLNILINTKLKKNRLYNIHAVCEFALLPEGVGGLLWLLRGNTADERRLIHHLDMLHWHHVLLLGWRLWWLRLEGIEHLLSATWVGVHGLWLHL